MKRVKSFNMHRTLKNQPRIALAGVAQWIEGWPVNQKVSSLIPSQGKCLGYGPGPQLGACERQRCIDVSLPLGLKLKNKEIK